MVKLEAPEVKCIRVEVTRGEYTHAVAIKCRRCGNWILEQYRIRMTICPFCDAVNIISEKMESVVKLCGRR